MKVNSFVKKTSLVGLFLIFAAAAPIQPVESLVEFFGGQSKVYASSFEPCDHIKHHLRAHNKDGFYYGEVTIGHQKIEEGEKYCVTLEDQSLTGKEEETTQCSYTGESDGELSVIFPVNGPVTESGVVKIRKATPLRQSICKTEIGEISSISQCDVSLSLVKQERKDRPDWLNLYHGKVLISHPSIEREEKYTASFKSDMFTGGSYKESNIAPERDGELEINIPKDKPIGSQIVTVVVRKKGAAWPTATICDAEIELTHEDTYIIPDPPDYKLCDQVMGPQAKESCISCIDQNGIWTAVGCIPTDSVPMLQTLIRIGLLIAGGFTLLIILAGAFMLSISQGDPKKTSEAKEMITSAIIGLIFIIFSVAVLEFIGAQILQIPRFGEEPPAYHPYERWLHLLE